MDENKTSKVQMTNAQRFAAALYKNGVRHIFGQSNPQSIMLACENLGIKQIAFRTENAGSYMAQGYGMMSNKIPVVAAQNGPAATLLVPGLAEAYKSAHAMVAIVDDVPRADEDRNAFQELNHHELFKGVTKYVKKINTNERIEHLVDRAFIEASSGRPGPVVLLCPKDIFYNEKVEEPPQITDISYSMYPLDRPSANIETLEKASEIIASSTQPLIYAGGGVNTSGAQNILRKIQEDFSLPVATTTMGKGSVDENHPLTLGPIGYYMGNRGRTKFLKEYVQNSDVIILIGNRTNQNGTDSWTLLPENAKYIHIDIDPSEIGKNYHSHRLMGDAKATLEMLYKLLKSKNYNNLNKEASIDTIKQAKIKHKNEIEEVLNSESSPLRIERVLSELNKQLSDDHIIVADASYSSIWIANYIDSINSRRFIFPRGLAGLGWGLPMAIGAKISKPTQKVFCLTGDGGFAHVWSELEVARRENTDVVIAIINNSILGYQKHAELSKWGEHTSACEFGNLNYIKIAEACGIKGMSIDKPEDISSKLQEALNYEGSVLIDLIIDENCIPPLPFMSSLDTI